MVAERRYLDRHKGCEVYKGQDHPDEPKKENPMEQVLTEEGEKTFYYMARNSTQPLHIPSPHVRLGLLCPLSAPGRGGRGGGEVAGVMPDDLLCVSTGG